ncbi:hypothetical protein ACFWDG_23985, partial [Peribacillus sp. NPDC060186]
YDECENTYNDFQESFRAYLDASILLAMAYHEINNEKAMLRVFEPTRALILDSYKKMNLLSTIAVSGKKDDDIMWYKNTEKIFNALDNYSQNRLLNSSEILTVEIEGRKLIREVVERKSVLYVEKEMKVVFANIVWQKVHQMSVNFQRVPVSM